MGSTRPRNVRLGVARVAGVVVWLAAWSLLVAQTCSPPLQYIYDDNDRLVAVVDTVSSPPPPGGNVALYTYDAVGNVLSIERSSSSTVRILTFTPKCGPAGSSVTILGTGFKTPASADTVQFTGASGPATITSAAAYQLVVTVPATATPGPITVTVTAPPTPPDNSAASSVPFEGPCKVPTITTIAPTLGAVGTPAPFVTITGTNFDPAPTANRVTFNLPNALAAIDVPTASTTQLRTNVPPTGTSGRITVETPLGTAQSAMDFFIPPLKSPGSGRFTVSEVTFTGRVAFSDAAQPFTSGAAQKIGLVVFDGTTGQLVSAQATAPSGWPNGWKLAILNPDGSYAYGPIAHPLIAFIDTRALLASGTHTFLVEATQGTGTVTLDVHHVVHFQQNVTINDPTMAVVIGTPGQNGQLDFTGTVNQPVTITATNNLLSPSGANALLKLLRTSVSPPAVLASGPINFPLAATLPATDTYAALVDPSQWSTGTVSVRVTSP